MDCSHNLDHLVGLMTIAIGSGSHHTRGRNDILLDNVIDGLLDDDEGKERTFLILDLLASTCVSDAEGQVVAIAFQLKL